MGVHGQDGGDIGADGHETRVAEGELACGHGAIDTEGKEDIDAQSG